MTCCYCSGTPTSSISSYPSQFNPSHQGTERGGSSHPSGWALALWEHWFAPYPSGGPLKTIISRKNLDIRSVNNMASRQHNLYLILVYIYMSVSLFGFVGELMKPKKCVTTYGFYSDSYHPTGLKGSMVIWKTTKITIHAKNHTKYRQRKHIIYSLAFLLALAGDIETNPGSQTKYLCGVCSKAVIRKGVACDTCDQWYHPKCMGMRDLIYKNLGHASWHCCNCALPNISDFLQTPIESSTNSFDCLNTTISSVSSIESLDQNYSPVARSSPLTQA